MKFLKNIISIAFAILSLNGCTVYVPKEYYQKYELVKKSSNPISINTNGYYYKYFYNNQYCYYYFFYSNHLVASVNLNRKENNSLISNPDSLLLKYINTENFKNRLNWAYYETKNDTLHRYDFGGPGPDDNNIFKTAPFNEIISIVEEGKTIRVKQSMRTSRFLFIFKIHSKRKSKPSEPLIFRSFNVKPDSVNNSVDLLYLKYINTKSRRYRR